MNTKALHATDELRDYQESTVDFLLKHDRAILGDEAGVGKTAPTLEAIKALGVKTLIVAPRNAFHVWKTEGSRWVGRAPVQYAGPGRDEADLDGDFVLTSYGALGEAKSRHWDLVVFDEAHKLKNRKAKTLFMQVQGGTHRGNRIEGMSMSRVWLLTGTPVVNGAQDLWTLLNIVEPQKYRSYWTFVKKYAWLESKHIGGGRFAMDVSGVRNAKALSAELTKCMLRRMKNDVLDELPDKTRQPVPLDCTPKQAKSYNQMAEQLMLLIDEGADVENPDNWLRAPGVLAQMTRLRQLLTTPRLLGIKEDGAAIEALREEAESGQTMVVFTPFAEAVPFIKSVLEEQDYEVGTITGANSPKQMAEAVDDFQANGADGHRALVSTIKMATSWTAHAASTCYFLGYDWVPGNNIQAEDRLHRFGQKNAVTAKYFVHAGSIDSRVLAILSGKLTVQRVLLEMKSKPTHWLAPEATGAGTEEAAA